MGVKMETVKDNIKKNKLITENTAKQIRNNSVAKEITKKL